MPYKHNQLKGIKKTFQNDTKVMCSSSSAIIWRLLLLDSHVKAKLRKDLSNNNNCQV